MVRPTLLLVPLLALSGCASLHPDAKEPIHVSVPGLRFGDEWSFATYENGKLKPGSGPTFKVGPEAETVLDRFGDPVRAVRIEMSHPLGYESRPFVRWIELDGGHTVVSSGGTWEDKGSCLYYAAPTVHGRMSFVQPMEMLNFPRTPVHASHGQPWGKSFVHGQTLEEKATRNDEFWTVQEVIEYRVINRVPIEALVMGGVPTETVVVEQRTHGRSLTPSADEWRAAVQWFLHPAYPVPVRVQIPEEHGPATPLYELERFLPGSKPVPFGNNPRPASFADVNPDSILSRASPAPPFGRLRLEFPFEDAMRAARTDPRSVSAALWLRSHPAAHAEQATYVRDIEPGIHKWSILLRDGNEGMAFTAERRILYGQAIDEASSVLGGTYSTRGYATAPPATDLGSALGVAVAFDPRFKDWDRLEWSIRRSSHPEGGPGFWYSFGLAETSNRSGPVPGTQVEVREYDPSVPIDGSSGGRSGHGPWWHRCEARLVLRPY